MAWTLTAEMSPDALAPEQERELVARAQRDLAAETFLAMVRYLPRFRWTGAPFRAWLYRLATNHVNRWAKRRRGWAVEQLHEETAGREEVDRSTSHDVERLR